VERRRGSFPHQPFHHPHHTTLSANAAASLAKHTVSAWTGGYLRAEDGLESAGFPSNKRFELRDRYNLSSLRRGHEVRDWDS